MVEMLKCKSQELKQHVKITHFPVPTQQEGADAPREVRGQAARTHLGVSFWIKIEIITKIPARLPISLYPSIS